MRHRRTMTWPGDMPELSLAKRAKHLACLGPWDDCATTIQPARRATAERIALVIGICIVVAIVVPMAVLAASARLRWALKVRLTNFLERERAREVYRTVYDFTTSISARLVTDAIEQRWGRTVPSGEAQFYVHSVIYEQLVILLLGNQDRARIFAARIDFQSRDPASGTLWFFDADGDDRIEAANQLRSGFNSPHQRSVAGLCPPRAQGGRHHRLLAATRGRNVPAAQTRATSAPKGQCVLDAARGVDGPHRLLAEVTAAPTVTCANQFVLVVAAKKAEVRDSLNLLGVVEHRAHPCGVAVDLALDVGDRAPSPWCRLRGRIC